jgi:MoxR-like ATPase
MTARLVFEAGPYEGEIIDLSDEDVTLGREPTCAIAMTEDPGISAHHARVRHVDGRWVIQDLKSTNGTEVNGQPVDSRVLTGGDVIEIGDSRLRFVLLEPPAPARPAAAPVAPPSAPKHVPPPAAARPAPRAVPGKLETSPEDVSLVSAMRENTDRIRAEVGKVIIGQREVLDQMLMCMMANGHALLVGLPGLAKTTMVRTVAEVLDLQFRRIQFTPDLMPSDITGTEILEVNRETQEKEFRFLRGPIFTQILLADEINRTPPKTQAALLEAMQEKMVTVGNVTYELEQPFFVLATQNPIEQEGTYPLPEAQMDRFMFNIWVDYPAENEEEEIVTATTIGSAARPEKILTREQVLHLQSVVRKIPVSPHVVKFAIRLVRSSRPDDPRAPDFIKKYVHIGAGPRAGQYLILAAKARAVLEGRIHVSCNDVRRAAIPVLRHRIYTNFAADSEGMTSNKIVEKLVETVQEPSESDYPAAAPAAR